MSSPIESAARNNAHWCDSICRAHGLPGEFHKHLWLNRQRVPRFYPNAVTLSENTGSGEAYSQIQSLVAAQIPGGVSVKDSFANLDLTALTFRVLFEAAWLWRMPSQPRPDAAIAAIRWDSVKNEAELAAWETAWNGPAGDDTVPPPRIFLPSLLADQDILFIAAYREQRIVAGAIANRTADVVGLSNIFVPEQAGPRFWAGCVAAALDAFPGLPLVGYEQGNELAIARGLGFAELGPLRVWVRDG